MDQDFEKERPMYEPIAHYGDAEQWNNDIPLRQKRMNEVVKKNVGRGMDNLEENGKNYATQAMIEINNLATSKASELDFENNIPEVNLALDTEGNVKYLTTHPEGVLHEHNDETLKAANLILNATSPELGLDIHDNFETAKEKAAPLVERGLADIDDWRIFFATVLPGIYVEYVQFDEDIDPDRQLSINITGVIEKFIPPAQ